MSTPELFAGVDVGASVVHGALVRRAGRRCEFVGARSGPPSAVAEWCGAAVRVAVDAPGGLSAGAHLDDFSVAPKFRTGRCSEVPIPGWPPVPWVTPGSGSAAAVPGWMASGFELWDGLCGYGTNAVETFPAGAFYRLNGRRWPPPKSSSAGRGCRLALLSGRVDLPPAAAGWGHDQIDAVGAAVVAALGHPAPHHCPRPDGSVMWVLG
jgi:predicted nuclease with RNAse H fold